MQINKKLWTQQSLEAVVGLQQMAQLRKNKIGVLHCVAKNAPPSWGDNFVKL